MMNNSTNIHNSPDLDRLLAKMDPLARAFFNHVANLNRASQRHVFQKFAARFSRVSPRTEREILAGHAIATAMRELGLADDERLKSHQYKSWFRDLTDERQEQFPSATTIARIFHNNWNDAIDSVVTTPIARFHTIRKRARGKAFTNEEIRAAIRLFAEENPNVTSFRVDWKPWAREKAAQGYRVPLAFHTVRQRFMTYSEFADAADAHWNRHMVVRFLSDDEMREIVREANREVDGTLTWAKFIAWRKHKLELDPTRAIPHHQTIATRIAGGDWAAARDSAIREGAAPTTGLSSTPIATRILDEEEAAA